MNIGNIIHRKKKRTERSETWLDDIETVMAKDPSTGEIGYYSRVRRTHNGGKTELGDWYAIHRTAYDLEED